MNAAAADPWTRAVYRLCRVGVWFGGALFILAALIVCVEVVIRKTIGATIGGAAELSGYALAVASAWAYGFALLERAHIRIDTLYATLPTRVAAVLDLLAITAFVGFFCLISRYALEVLLQTIDLGSRSMTPLQTPLVIPQTLWFAGLCVVVLTGVVLMVRASILFATGDVAACRNLIGSRTVKDELDGELAEQDRTRDDAGPAAPSGPVAEGALR